MSTSRKSGILLPVFSLPSPYGIGTFGKAAYDWVDFLKASGQSIWQVLPLGPTSYGDSPYQSPSSYAGNPYFIDPDMLIGEGLLTRAECAEKSCDFTDGRAVDYGALYSRRYALLHTAYSRFISPSSGLRDWRYTLLDEFADEHFWVRDYCFYMAYKSSVHGLSWQEWTPGIRLRDERQINNAKKRLRDDIYFQIFLQYKFFEQWSSLKKYANENGVSILGDLPIYLSLDSSDVWKDRSLFRLDEDGHPTDVAGVPPDGFSPTGQLWGNPLYNWSLMAEDGYAWWMKRLECAFGMFDHVRIDHFRGFESYYAVPAGDKTAERGVWLEGPGMDFINAIHEHFGDASIIAEDLGFLTDEVRSMLEGSGFPGMKVLLFAFGGDPAGEYLPHNHIKNCVVYTGTHDNETAAGWFGSLTGFYRDFAGDYLGCKRGADAAELTAALVRTALSSVADTVIIPMQDWLALGNEARVNQPSTLGGNWSWRLDQKALVPALSERISYLTWMYGRKQS